MIRATELKINACISFQKCYNIYVKEKRKLWKKIGHQMKIKKSS